MAVHTFTITDWHPVKLNDLIGRHWGVVKARKDKDKLTVFYASINTPKAEGKRRVTVTITLGPRQHGADPDAYFKGLGDSLQYAGMLRNDNKESVEWAPVEYVRGERMATTIKLEDI